MRLNFRSQPLEIEILVRQIRHRPIVLVVQADRLQRDAPESFELFGLEARYLRIRDTAVGEIAVQRHCIFFHIDPVRRTGETKDLHHGNRNQRTVDAYDYGWGGFARNGGQKQIGGRQQHKKRQQHKLDHQFFTDFFTNSENHGNSSRTISFCSFWIS